MGKVSLKRKIRRNRIVQALFGENELSLTMLSQRTGLSLPMVTALSNELAGEGFVSIIRNVRQEHAGRPPIVVSLKKQAGCIMGIDMGHRNTTLVLLNLGREKIVEKTIASYPLGNDPLAVEWLMDSVQAVLREHGVSMTCMLGLGLALPGIVRGREGRSESFLNFGETSLRTILERKFGVPISIENTAKAMAHGELWFGSAIRKRNVLCLNIGWGLGLGVLHEGRIFYGRDGFAGEFGHIQVLPKGEPCYCGRRGCLETEASGMAIGRQARTRVRAGEQTRLTEMCGGNTDSIDATMVVRAAIEGDALALEILREGGRLLGRHLALLLNLFNPECVILGGRVALAGPLLIDTIRTTALRTALPAVTRRVEFVLSQLGPGAGALGVAMLAARDLFEIEHMNPSAFV